MSIASNSITLFLARRLSYTLITRWIFPLDDCRITLRLVGDEVRNARALVTHTLHARYLEGPVRDGIAGRWRAWKHRK